MADKGRAWYQRLQLEASELAHRIERLKTYVEANIGGDTRLHWTQLHIMRALSNVLEMRIAQYQDQQTAFPPGDPLGSDLATETPSEYEECAATWDATEYKIDFAKEATMHREEVIEYFAFSHLPEQLQMISQPFGLLAYRLLCDLPRSEQRSIALQKLLEAKDAAVRAAIKS